MHLIKQFLKDEQGLELTEYAVIMALIIAGTAAAVGTLGGLIQGAFDDTNTTLQNEGVGTS